MDIKNELRLWAKDDIVPSDLQVLCRQAAKSIADLEGKLKWHKEEKLRLEKEVHRLKERIDELVAENKKPIEGQQTRLESGS